MPVMSFLLVLKGFERHIINVAPGDISSNSTDAINGSQLYGVLSSLEKIRYFFCEV